MQVDLFPRIDLGGVLGHAVSHRLDNALRPLEPLFVRDAILQRQADFGHGQIGIVFIRDGLVGVEGKIRQFVGVLLDRQGLHAARLGVLVVSPPDIAAATVCQRDNQRWLPAR